MKTPIPWAGSKRNLARRILDLGQGCLRYVEPFVGGGACFFEAIDRPFESYAINDINGPLIGFYRAMSTPDTAQDLVWFLEEFRSKDQDSQASHWHYMARRIATDLDKPVFRHWFLPLIQGAMANAWRVNRDGEFNQSKRPSWKFCYDPGLLDDCIRALCFLANLSRLSITLGDYSAVHIKRGDFVYIDPPYYNESRPTHTAYSSSNTGIDFHARLAARCFEWRELGARVVVSSIPSDLYESLYDKASCIRRMEVYSNLNKIQEPRHEWLIQV